jgi:hypothetical protein
MLISYSLHPAAAMCSKWLCRLSRCCDIRFAPDHNGYGGFASLTHLLLPNLLTPLTSSYRGTWLPDRHSSRRSSRSC